MVCLLIPILYDPGETAFTDLRRSLTHAVSCTVRQDTSGRDELTLKYPVAGAHADEIGYNSIILAKPNLWQRPQPYRVYSVSKPANGLFSVAARHLAYDGLGIPVKPFTATSAADAAQKLKSQALTTCPFTMTTDIVSSKPMSSDVPKSLRALVATDSDSWLKIYGGGLVFDRFEIKLLANPGTDRGVTIAYGVDLVDLQQEECIANTYTGILPYWAGTESVISGGETVQVPVCIWGSIRRPSGTFPVEKILPVDLTEYFEEQPTVQQLNDYGDLYVSSKGVGIPQVSLRLSWAQLGQDVRLFDTVGVDFERLGISTRAVVSGMTFDVLNEIYTAVEVGAERPQLVDSLSDAGRLTTGKLPKDRIADHSVGSSALAASSVSEKALAAYAVTKQKLAALAVGAYNLEDYAVTENKIGNLAVATGKIKDSAVSYGKTSFTGTLDQVGVNKSNIDAINGYFTGQANFNYLAATQIWLNSRQLRAETVSIGGSNYNLVRWIGYD